MKLIIILSMCSLASADFLFGNFFSKFTQSFKKAPISDSRIDNAFANFTRDFKKENSPKNMNGKSLTKAREYFANTWLMVDEHNKRFKLGLTSYSQTIYAFADEDPEEAVKYLCGTELPHTMRSLFSASPKAASYPTGPPSKDWSSLVLKVRDQRTCGSCWAFSTTAQVEARLRMKNPKYSTPLSPQHLIDCSTRDNNGCYGGWPKRALDFIISNSMTPEMNYVYRNVQNTCKNTLKVPKPISKSFQHDLRGNEEYLKNIVALEGPVVIAAYITRRFMSYRRGIFEDPFCSNFVATCRVNHAMLVVGYGHDSLLKKDFWLVLNSWGPFWGESGYIRIARNSRNNCNIACFAMYGK